jgi:RNA polymerase sigma factor (TIGR02999 family)
MTNDSDSGSSYGPELMTPVEYRSLSDEVYRTLRVLARRQLRREARVLTLETSALVHEAWIRLAVQGGSIPAPHSTFLAIASRVMRQVLVDYARSRARVKRRAPAAEVEPAILSDEQAVDVMAIHKALQRLERADERKCRVVEMRFFGGCTVEETAEALGVSSNTVLNDWAFARRWLARQLRYAV